MAIFGMSEIARQLVNTDERPLRRFATMICAKFVRRDKTCDRREPVHGSPRRERRMIWHRSVNGETPPACRRAVTPSVRSSALAAGWALLLTLFCAMLSEPSAAAQRAPSRVDRINGAFPALATPYVAECSRYRAAVELVRRVPQAPAARLCETPTGLAGFALRSAFDSTGFTWFLTADRPFGEGRARASARAPPVNGIL